MRASYSDKNLKTLPCIPPNIKELFCSDNKLKILPELPNIWVLDCFNNRLKTLPKLLNISVLDCANNKIKDYSRYVKISKDNKYLNFIKK